MSNIGSLGLIEARKLGIIPDSPLIETLQGTNIIYSGGNQVSVGCFERKGQPLSITGTVDSFRGRCVAFLEGGYCSITLNQAGKCAISKIITMIGPKVTLEEFQKAT